MLSVKDIKNCYGCGVCATVCMKQAITISLNSQGFYTPIVDESICNKCGLCLNVCSFNHNELSNKRTPLKGYGAWSNDPFVRQRCSSGGVGLELGKYLLTEGYKVCGVKYNVGTQRAEHYIANNEEELRLSIGSKYIQSYTVDGFRAINRNEKYLVTGTPCQIDSFRRYIRKFKVEENFILMDFFCHSVPSMLAWKKYTQIVEKTTGPIVYASWRNKFTGWHDSWVMAIDGEATIGTTSTNHWCENYNTKVKEKKHQYNSWFSKGDTFYKLFLGDYCCNPACQKDCKFKYDQSSADIRIGDLWGDTYKDNENGVSGVVTYTEKGDKILNKLNCTFIEHPFEVVAEGQMKNNAGKAYLSSIVMRLLKSDLTSTFLFRVVFILEFLIRLPRRVINKFLKLIWEK